MNSCGIGLQTCNGNGTCSDVSQCMPHVCIAGFGYTKLAVCCVPSRTRPLPFRHPPPRFSPWVAFPHHAHQPLRGERYVPPFHPPPPPNAAVRHPCRWQFRWPPFVDGIAPTGVCGARPRVGRGPVGGTRFHPASAKGGCGTYTMPLPHAAPPRCGRRPAAVGVPRCATARRCQRGDCR